MLIEAILTYAIPALLLLLGFFVGSWRERRHFASLELREAQARDIGVVNLRTVAQPEAVQRAALVAGQAVIATDYFKGFVAWIRKVTGGEIKVYNRLMERARREAMLRMIDEARAIGATEIWNVRYGSSNILSSSGNNPAVAVEVFAYGTAIVRGAPPVPAADARLTSPQ